VVPLGNLHVSLLTWWHTTHHELLKRFEDKALIEVIEQKETVPVYALEYQV